MKNVIKKTVLIYGLYLGWILSFTYEGPLFDILINSEHYNINILLLVMHVAPIVLITLWLYRYINKDTDTKWLYVVISSSLVFSLLFVLFGSNIDSSLRFGLLIVLSVLTGTAELIFIMCATGWYIRYIPVKHMFVAMAFVVLVANMIVMICDFLVLISMDYLSIAVSFAACFISLVIAVTNKKSPAAKRPHRHVELPRHTICWMCTAFYLLNVGGGVVFEVIDPLISRSFGFLEIFSILPYIIACVLIILLLRDKKPKIEYFLIVSTGIIIIGLILFQFIDQKSILLVTNTLIKSGYAVMDVFMWGLVGLLSYVYSQPYKIVLYTMSANILGVLTGVIISKVLTQVQISDESIPTLISLICALIGTLIIPVIYKTTVTNLYKDMALLEQEGLKQEKLHKIKQYEALTTREKEVAKLLVLDMTNRRIAADLYISENTLKKHAKNIYTKLQVGNKRELKSLFSAGYGSGSKEK